jgi:CTP:phosphocholine cytidylyltransferase-like protein
MTYTSAECTVEIPDDGRRNYPKHVEFLENNKFGKINVSVGFIKKKFVTMRRHKNVKLLNAFFSLS